MEENTEHNAPNTKTNPANSHHKSHAKPSRIHNVPLNAILITFTVIVLAIFFGAQLVLTTGIFRPAGKVILDDNLTEENIDFINTNLPSDLTLDSDVTIRYISSSARYSDTNPAPGMPCIPSADPSLCPKPEKVEYVLYNILLPTTDWDNPEINISFASVWNSNLVSVWNLNKSQKLLKLDNAYFLDDMDQGAVFQYFQIGGQTEDVQKVADILTSQIAAFPTQDEILTLAQTGVTALSRRMNAKLAQVGDAKYFAEKIGPFLSSFDFTHTSNEASFSPLATSSNICSQPAMIDVFSEIGLDIVELTGNHNQDCGDDAAIATIELYEQMGIKTFGGGTTQDTAAIPLEIDAKDAHITLLGYNLSTGGYTLDGTPGANYYTKEKAQNDVNAAKARGDTVIVDIQYYECNEYASTTEDATCDSASSAAGDQVGFFRELIDMGADVVVGTAAHQPQTFEQYHGGEIYYGLGNLFFDQSAWPGTTRSLVLVHYFLEGKLVQTRIVPTVYDNNFQTELMSDQDAANFLARLLKSQPEPPADETDSGISQDSTS